MKNRKENILRMILIVDFLKEWNIIQMKYGNQWKENYTENIKKIDEIEENR